MNLKDLSAAADDVQVAAASAARAVDEMREISTEANRESESIFEFVQPIDSAEALIPPTLALMTQVRVLNQAAHRLQEAALELALKETNANNTEIQRVSGIARTTLVRRRNALEANRD